MWTDRYTEMAAAIADYGGQLQGALNGVGNAAVEHSDVTTVAVVVVLAGIAVLAALRFTNNNMPADEAAEMRKRVLLDQKYADMIGDGLFDMLHAGEIDRHEYKRACRRFGIAFRLGDLLTRKNGTRGLAKRVRGNCAAIHATPSACGKIPGPKIGEDVPASPLVIKPVPIQRKVWVVAGKMLLRSKERNS